MEGFDRTRWLNSVCTSTFPDCQTGCLRRNCQQTQRIGPTVSAGFSITGMTAVFVGATLLVIGMGIAIELGKLSAVACLGRRYGSPALRAALVALVAVPMGLNAF
jgi:hypothetical protein